VCGKSKAPRICEINVRGHNDRRRKPTEHHSKNQREKKYISCLFSAYFISLKKINHMIIKKLSTCKKIRK
jgi:hypothetical protein